jgi:hypothetical protein
MVHVNALKPIRFETNMLQKQRKCNKQKIQCFVALLMIMEFISLVTQDFYNIFTLRTRENIKNPVSLVK